MLTHGCLGGRWNPESGICETEPNSPGETLTGTIEYRIRCEQNDVAGPCSKSETLLFYSNTMLSDFTAVGGSGSYLDEPTRFVLGVRDQSGNLIPGCGCEPWIEEY